MVGNDLKRSTLLIDAPSKNMQCSVTKFHIFICKYYSAILKFLTGFSLLQNVCVKKKSIKIDSYEM